MRKIGTCLLVFTAISIQVSFFLSYTKLIPAPSLIYSEDSTFRLQVKALLSGRFSLGNDLKLLSHDYAWTGKAEQIWGLGVALVQLPFDVVANLFGYEAFPDRVHLLLCLIGALIFSMLQTQRMVEKKTRFSYAQTYLISFGWTSVWFFTPAFLVLFLCRYDVYEQAVVYGFLCSTVLFFAFIRSWQSRSYWVYYFTCFLSGFVIWFRPTLLVYGVVTLLLLFLKKRNEGFLLKRGLLIFLGVFIPLLICNQVRFGHFLEFGQHLSITGGHVLYETRFGSPFIDQVPIIFRAKEFFSLLFLMDQETIRFDRVFDQLWNTNVIRARDIDFRAFDSWVLGALLIAWFFLLKNWLISRLGFTWISVFTNATLEFSVFLWSSLSFVSLFIFYMSYNFYSRYFLDFAPAILSAILIFSVSTVLRLKSLLGSRSLLWVHYSMILLAVVWTISLLIEPLNFLTPFPKASSQTASSIEKITVAMNKVLESSISSDVPSEYLCPTSVWNRFPKNNALGWDIQKTCHTTAATPHYLPSTACVRFEVSVFSSSLSERNLNFKDIRVKVGRHQMDLNENQKIGNVMSLKYCLPKGARPQEKFNLVVISWYDHLREKIMPDVSPFFLHSIRSVSENERT